MPKNKRLLNSIILSIVAIFGLATIITGLRLNPAKPAHAATTYTVTNANDSGAGSLRQAILDANSNPGADIINFDAAYSIQILTSLPTITEQVEINGYTGAPGGAAANSAVSPAPFNGTLTIEIDGTNIPIDGGQCLILNGADNSVIRGLVINNCGNDGILVQSSNFVTIAGNYIGTDTTGLIDEGNGRGYAVSSIAEGISAIASNNMTIGGTAAADRNIIAGNQAGDVFIGNEGDLVNPSENNTIQGNYIGVGANGTTALPSGYADGLGNAILLGNSHNDQIGGTTSGTMNVIGSSDEYGVGFRDGCSGTVVEGNYIGTDYTGGATLAHSLGTGNISAGVHVGTVSNAGFTRPSHDITIGGNTSASRNIISGNSNSGGGQAGGVTVDDGAYNTVVSGNYIGVAADGTTDLGNEGIGVQIGTVGGAGTYSSHDNTIGGDTAGERNIISGNGNSGISFYGEVSDITISGNYIGVDSTGNVDLGNDGTGISMNYSDIVSSRVIIGGDTAGERNIISGNGWRGIDLTGENVAGVTISTNYIGVGANGTTDLGNNEIGIEISNFANNITIGGDSSTESNVISGNGSNGVVFYQAGASNVVSGNYIGVDSTGNSALSNNGDGVQIGDSDGVQVGGSTSGERNIISSNVGSGVNLVLGSANNTILGNYIGLGADGTTILANGEGVNIDSSPSNIIGGTSSEARNIISGNTNSGVAISNSSANGNIVIGNYIGTDATGNIAKANGTIGVNIYNGPSGNTIGGTTSGSRNVISGNTIDGVHIDEAGSNNSVSANYIGLNSAGTSALANGSDGIEIANTSNTLVGGDN